ncbi:MAG: L-histidine N(alpha)-methyltransferase, partial [Actinobacteria bacterium]|nr:L-histidine N(alpha)-methyltransferase [Actinomycetota bacterium]
DIVMGGDGKGLSAYVSLAPGDGSKDSILLRALLASMGADSTLTYYPCHPSAEALMDVVRRVSVMPEISAVERLRIKAVLASIKELAKFVALLPRDGRRLLSLLDNRLGSMADDAEYLEYVSQWAMRPGDYLLLEVARTGSQVPGDADALLPLQLLQDLGIETDPSRLHWTVSGNRSEVPGTSTATAYYSSFSHGGRDYAEVPLGQISLYDRRELGQVLGRAGLYVVTAREGRRSLTYLLRRGSIGNFAP